MDPEGVYRTILAARRGNSPSAIVQFANAYRERIIPAVTTKMFGSKSSGNRRLEQASAM